MKRVFKFLFISEFLIKRTEDRLKSVEKQIDKIMINMYHNYHINNEERYEYNIDDLINLLESEKQLKEFIIKWK